MATTGVTTKTEVTTQAPPPVASRQATEMIDSVLAKVKAFHEKKELDLPPNYSAANALKSAWLILQETVDRNKQPALQVCTKASIANALLFMVVQGLNPAKKQAYFIVRGKTLCLDRSYFGTKAVALRVDKTLDDIYAECIYEGDDLEYSIVNGQRIIGKHVQKFENIKDDKIAGAYAVAIRKDGTVKRSDLMTMEQLKQAWKQSSMSPVTDEGDIKASSTHGKFTGEMAKKTVTSRLAKHIINVSSDSDLVVQIARQNEYENEKADSEAEIEEFGNKEFIDITPEPSDSGEMTDAEKAEILAEEQAKAKAKTEAPQEGPDF